MTDIRGARPHPCRDEFARGAVATPQVYGGTTVRRGRITALACLADRFVRREIACGPEERVWQ